MRKYKNYLLFVSLFFMPTIVYASSGDNSFSLITALGIEAFTSIHMSLFFLLPLAELISFEKKKEIFWRMFILRLVILLFCDFFISTYIAIFDFIFVFVGVFIIYPIALAIRRKINSRSNKALASSIANTISSQESVKNNEVMTCAKCGEKLEPSYNFCGKCGAKVEEVQTIEIKEKTNTVKVSDFEPIYAKSEDEVLEDFINKEMKKANFEIDKKLVPKEVVKRRSILSILFAILLFVSISLIFFHFPNYTYIIDLIILVIFYIMSKKYNLISYLKKEAKSRPDEKISNIVMSVKTSLVYDNYKILRAVLCLIATVAPLIIFKDPKIMYEKQGNGYAVRFYTFGLTNYKTATIPEVYNNKNVISLRGNAFSNMPFLEKVTLPDTIVEIRGQAFKNDVKLTSVNIPKELKYLGGGSFYNCKSIKKIELPDTLTYMGGETFYKASALTNIKLSENLKEIRGDSFEYCTSLKEITIPDKVSRIGGHAFYGASSLEKVELTEDSSLKEIGSSAFRKCNNLHTITIPSDTYVNERAFKESPTVVRHFNQVDYGSSVDRFNYDYSSFMLLYTNQKQKVNEYRSYAKVKDAYLELESVDVLEDGNNFNLKYINGDEEISFTLSKMMPYKEISDDLAVEVASEYNFSRVDNVSLNIYYN